MTSQQEILFYRDSRNQLIKNLSIGMCYPISELAISTKQQGETTNSTTILYSKIAFDTQEEIHIDHPQEDTKYELVELNPHPGKSNTLLGEAVTSNRIESSETASPLILSTPKIGEQDRTFAILATTNQLHLSRYLDKVIKVRAGINQNLDVSIDRNIVEHMQVVKVTVHNGQAGCEYVLARDPYDGGVLPLSTERPLETAYLSAKDYALEVRDVILTSIPLKENTALRVYGRFKNSSMGDYLTESHQVSVIPNPFIPATAVRQQLSYLREELTEITTSDKLAQIQLLNTQTSATYQAYFHWVDPTGLLKPMTDTNRDYQEEDWIGSQQRDGIASEAFDGSGEQPLTIPLNKSLPEDVSVRIVATNKVSGLSTPLQILSPTSQNKPASVHELDIRFQIYPDTTRKVVLISQSVKQGDRAYVRIEKAQVGGYYQLYNLADDEPMGPPQFMRKNRTLEIASVGVDLSIAPAEAEDKQVLKLWTTPLETSVTCYVQVTKPINGLSARLKDLITINVLE